MPRKSTVSAIADAPVRRPIDEREAVPARELETRLIERALIHPDPAQPRKSFDDELRADLIVRGQLDPITVRPHPEILTEWMLVNGERRWRSAEGVLSSLRCQIDDTATSHAQRLANQLSHNLGKPLTPLEEAHAFADIIAETGMSVADTAEFLGRPKSSVGERLALLELGPWLEMIESGELPLSHAVKVLLPLRTAADAVHAHAIELLKNDYRYKNQGGGAGISLGDFERLVKQLYLPSMYPLTKTKTSYAKQPEIAPAVLARHDEQCDCGGIAFDLGGNAPRKCCGNPGWWRPLHRAALKAKPKKKAQGRERGPKPLYLPPGVPVLKSDYGQTPKGVERLTDSNGNWSFGPYDAFDPADLDIDEKKLVQWSGHGNQYPYVGTKDIAAVKKARAAWGDRWAAQYDTLLHTELAALLHQQAPTYKIEGAGAPYIAAMLVSYDRVDAMIDLARAQNLELPGKLLDAGNAHVRAGAFAKWAMSQSLPALEGILGGMAMLAALKRTAPSARIEQLKMSVLATIQQRDIPWKKKPAPVAPPKAKTSAKKVVGRASKAATTKPMYASPALAKVVGTAAITRDEVTKRFWAYVKKHNLAVGHGRKDITADATLKAVFGGKEKISLFDVTKVIDKHLAGTVEAAALIYAGKKKPGEIALEQLSPETAELPLPASCVYCECTEDNACQDESGTPCHWVHRNPDVCSAPDCVVAYQDSVTERPSDEAEDEEDGYVATADGDDDDASLWDAELGGDDREEVVA